jgi:hypothetical protein
MHPSLLGSHGVRHVGITPPLPDEAGAALP